MPSQEAVEKAWCQFLEVMEEENYEMTIRYQDDDENAPEGSVRLIWMEPETLWAVPKEDEE